MKRSGLSAIGLGLSLLIGAGLARAQAPGATPAKSLSPENRLAIVRVLAYEYATARQILPATSRREEALEMDAAGQINEDRLRRVLAKRGPAVNPGEIVQITDIEFRKNFILFYINGSKKKKKWYERIRIEAGTGGGGPPVQVERQPPPGAPGSQPSRPGVGSLILLNFPEGVPDLTSAEVKQQLAAVLDFSRQTAAVPWIETIPEEFRQAIKAKQVIVGMDSEMVLAARGRPDRKVRENKDGVEVEDWIYGNPPLVIFVRFVDGKVVEIKDFR